MRAIAGIVAGAMFLQASPASAGSVAATTVTFNAAVARAGRIVVGRVTGTAPFTFEKATFSTIEIGVERTLKGPAGRPGETLRVFDPGQWFQHTHEAAIRGGVISYEDPRYATPVRPSEIKKDAVLIFFLND